MKKKQLISALLSLSIAASSLSFAGCKDNEYDESVNKKTYYVLEFEGNDLIVYEIKGYPSHNELFNDFKTSDGRNHRVYMENCIITKNKEEAESYYNMFIMQENKNAIWIGEEQEAKTKTR